MRIVLTEDVVGVGDIGETVKVRPGFARNYLIPRGFAIEAGSVSANALAHRMRQIEAKKRRLKSEALAHAKTMEDVVISLGLRVGSGGKVFGSITSRDVADKLAEQGFAIDRRRVLLSAPVKKIGAYYVELKLHPEVKVQVRLDVTAVAATKEEEAKELEEAKSALQAATPPQSSSDSGEAEAATKPAESGKKKAKSAEEGDAPPKKRKAKGASADA